MVEYCKFNRYVTASAPFYSSSSLLDLFAKIERPFGIRARRIKNGSDIVPQNNGGEEADIDVACDLKDVLVLPVVVYQLKMHEMQNKRAYHFFPASSSESQGLYFPSSFTESRDSAIWLWFLENMSRTATTPGGIIMIRSDAIESG
jgi:hypothetical protein